MVVPPAPVTEVDDPPRRPLDRALSALAPEAPPRAPRRPVVPRRTWPARLAPSVAPATAPPAPGPAATPAPPAPREGAGAPDARRRGRLRSTLVVLAALLVTAGVLLGARSDTVAPAPAPATLASGAVTYRSVDVTWTPAPGATSYLVRVATDPALRDVVRTVVVGAPAVLDTRATPAQVAAASPVQLHLDGPGITEGTDLFVGVTSTAHGIVGGAARVLLVHTPLQAPAAATGLVAATDTQGATLTWHAAPRATGYQVVVASDAAMTKVLRTSSVVHGTSYRVALRDGARYFAQVRTIRGPAHAGTGGEEQVVRGPSSAVRGFSTPLKTLGKPAVPAVRPLSATSVKISWKPVRNATRYTVTFADTPTSRQRTVVTTTRTSVVLDGVRPQAMHLRPIFSVRVAADRWGLVRHTSKPRTATLLAGVPKTPVAFRTTVATYNLLRTDFDDDAGRTWKQRFTLSGKQLRGVGVAGLQETGWDEVDGVRPVAVVAKAAHLRVAAHPHSSAPCTTKNQPVLYAPKTFELLGCGYQKISSKGTTGIDARYATWVELRDRRSHQRVLVVNTHLTAYTSSDSSGSPAAQRARTAQARRLLKVVAKHRRPGEPVLLTGDLNSFAGSAVTTPLDVLAAAGYTSADLTARSTRDGQYASFHDFDGARATARPIDHVVMDAAVVATSYRVHVTTSRKAPSDHYEVSAVVEVHRSR